MFKAVDGSKSASQFVDGLGQVAEEERAHKHQELALYGEAVKRTAPGLFRSLAASWRPRPGEASPTLPLFRIQNTLLGKASALVLSSGLMRKLANTVDGDWSFKYKDLSAIMLPIQDELAQKGWTSWVFFCPAITETFGDQDFGYSTSRKSGYVGIRIAPAGSVDPGYFGECEDQNRSPADNRVSRLALVSVVEGRTDV
jgi:hypothetical protein